MKKILAIMLAGIVLLTACVGGADPAPTAENGLSAPTITEGVIVIDYPTFQTGVNTAAPVVERLVAEFNQRFEGQFYINKISVPGDQNYFDLIRVQIGAGGLPPVIYGGGHNLLDLVHPLGMAVDLTDVINADPEWIARFDYSAMVANSRDGRILASSNEASRIGFFYNRELFAQAGLDGPAQTWDEFWEQLDTLQAAGITPLSMDTGDNAWVTMLWLGAMVGTAGPAGLEFMNTMNPVDYSTPEMIAAITNIQRMLQNYTTPDAVGGRYENAANNFFSGQTAMLANGPWMIADFYDLSLTTEGFADNIGVAAFPGGWVYDATIQGFIVTQQDDPALEAAAIEMVRFFTSDEAQVIALEMQGMLPASPTVPITDYARERFRLLSEFLEASAPAENRGMHFSATMFANVIDALPRELPRLAFGEITPEEFAQILSAEAAVN